MAIGSGTHRVVSLVKALRQSYHNIPLLHQQLLVPLHLSVVCAGVEKAGEMQKQVRPRRIDHIAIDLRGVALVMRRSGTGNTVLVSLCVAFPCLAAPRLQAKLVLTNRPKSRRRCPTEKRCAVPPFFSVNVCVRSSLSSTACKTVPAGDLSVYMGLLGRFASPFSPKLASAIGPAKKKKLC